MQSAQATEALGVQLYFYVRCPTCGKVLGNLQDDYIKLIKAADDEVRYLIPHSLSYADTLQEYDNAMAIRFGSVMKKLGVIRPCCMMRIKNPQQVPVANLIQPEGSIAINRHTPGIKRNPTVIELTKRSRVPGGSNISMMSITGYEETLGLPTPGVPQGINAWEEKMLKELDSTKPAGNIITTQIMESTPQKQPLSISSPQVLSPTTFSGLVPTIESGVNVPIKKRPRIVNAKTNFVASTTVTLPDMMELENSRILSFDAVPQTLGSAGHFGNSYSHEDRMTVDSSDLMDIQNLTLSSQY